MATQKLKLSRPNRMAHRLVKTANALNSVAELLAETVVALTDASSACMRLVEEIEEQAKEKEKEGKG